MHLRYLSNTKTFLSHRSTHGFTLPEVLVAILAIGILGAVALPSWLNFVDVQRLKTAQSEVYNAMRQAQSQASKEKITWQTSFREQNGILQWAVHPATVNPSSARWNNLDSHIRIDNETTLARSDDGIRKLQFDYRGNVNVFRRITLSSKNGGKAKRCVYISTLLGAMRMAKERNRPEDGKYCY